jgi:hypothetical protein
MQRVTERWHQTLLAWLANEETQAGKIEHYLMQIAFHVARGPVQHPERLKLEDFKLRAGESEEKRDWPVRPMTQEQVDRVRSALAKAGRRRAPSG